MGVTPLANGNVLITDHIGVREVTHRGDSVWSFTPSEVPGYRFANLQQAWRLPNGNTVVNNWASEWSKTPENAPGAVQALELTPAKQVAWALREWTPPANLGPATTIQFLDEPSAPEDVRFGRYDRREGCRRWRRHNPAWTGMLLRHRIQTGLAHVVLAILMPKLP